MTTKPASDEAKDPASVARAELRGMLKKPKSSIESLIESLGPNDCVVDADVLAHLLDEAEALRTHYDWALKAHGEAEYRRGRLRAIEEARLVIEMHEGAQIFDGEPQRDPVATLQSSLDTLEWHSFEEIPSVREGFYPHLLDKYRALKGGE